MAGWRTLRESLAEIAGVFVGFGALVAMRSGGPSEPLEVALVRGVVITTPPMTGRACQGARP